MIILTRRYPEAMRLDALVEETWARRREHGIPPESDGREALTR